MSKEDLIKEGERLLNVIYPKDVFNIGSIDYVMSPENIEKLDKWAFEVKVLIVKSPLKELFNVDSQFYDQHNRVLKDSIEFTINLLKRLD